MFILKVYKHSFFRKLVTFFEIYFILYFEAEYIFENLYTYKLIFELKDGQRNELTSKISI